MRTPARPPGPEWVDLVDRDGAGYLTVFYSDPLARYPVRHITRRRDNKSDPNLETGTYGLFSTCGLAMRGKLVREGRTHLFFLTMQAGKGRVLAGYYGVGWTAESTGGAARGDHALAACRMRWVAPIAVESLPPSLRALCATQFRSCRPMDAGACAGLLEVIGSADDRTDDYLAEIDRLERYAAHWSGYRYPSWGRRNGFSLEDADRYLGAIREPDGRRLAATGEWRCRTCGGVSVSGARLKSCPLCEAMGSLEPEVVR